MSRYIDIENFCENLCHCNNEYCDKLSCPILNAPTADVAEVKHGEWKIEEYKNHLNVVCPNCNKEFYVYKQGQYRIDRSNYCPNCGARMDGGDFDEMPNIKSQE